MSADPPSSGAAPTPAEIRRQVQQILSSTTFSDTERLRGLFTWLMDEFLAGHGSQLKESLIGVEVFHREPSWDPQTDALVRVQMRNLRLRLARYYDEEGPSSEVLISIPRGQYVPLCQYRTPAAPPRPVGASRRTVWFALGGLAAAGLLLAMAEMLAINSRPPAMGVVPIQNLSGDSRNDYLAIGLTEELTALLARSRALRVASIPGSDGAPLEVSEALRAKARQAGVEFVVLGSIRPEGKANDQTWSVAFRLLDVRNGFYLWSEHLSLRQAQLESLPERVAREIRRVLSMPDLDRPRRETAEEHSPAIVEAHELYLRALYLRSRSTEGGAEEARKLLERAVTLDPHHSRAQAALGEAYLTVAFHEGGNNRARYEAARRQADLAEQLDPLLPEVLVLRSRIAMIADWNAATAERYLRSALDEAPASSRIHQAYAILLMSRGRTGESLEQIRMARDLDPITMSHANDYGVVLYAARRYPEALREADRLLELEPQSGKAHLLRATVLGLLSRYPESIREFEIALRLQPRLAELRARYGATLARSGRPEDARAVLAALSSESRPHVYQAMVLTALHDHDRALAELRLACDGHEVDMLFLDAEPLFDPLRTQAEFQRVRARVGLARAGD